jgi:hypothetical protein
VIDPLVLGYNALNKKIRLTSEERKTHMHVIGSSGSGKSKFLEWMIRGDLNNGQGFCLIDPHGKLYDDVMAYCAHHVLRRPIIPLNLSAGDQIVSFNPFQKAGQETVEVQVDKRIAATLHAWGVRNSDGTPTLERTLRLFYTVMIDQNLGLADLEHLIDFNAHEIRGHLIERLQNPLIQKELQELQKLKARDWREETLSAKNRLFRLLTSPALRRVMGLPDRAMDLKAAMDDGKILLVNLAPSDRLSDEHARVFGALLINEFYETALRRDDRNPTPYYLYIDEFQEFVVTPNIAKMLDEMRKFGLYTILSHQRFGQLTDDLVDALTNCKIKAVFGGLPVKWARYMAEELFINELDPKRIKVAIYQTKFWPTYTRDTVYTHASSTGRFAGRSDQWSHATLGGQASGQFFQPNDWFSGGPAISLTTNTSDSSVFGGSRTDGDSSNETDAQADIPTLLPVPFKELSSVQYFPLDEQLTQLTAALKEQFPRHCFIKIHEQKTQPMLVPFVEDYHTPPSNLAWYVQTLLKEQNALPAAEVDRLIKERKDALLKAAIGHNALPEDFHE